MANGRPIFTKSILGNVEIFAVIGIFSLYALEFAGIHTFSQLIPVTETQAPVLSFLSGEGVEFGFTTGTVIIMAVIPLILIIYFAFLRKRIKVRR